MFEDYIAMDKKKLGLFIGSIAGTVIITTVLYWIVYGVDLWKAQINQASALMTAAAVVPLQPQPGYNNGTSGMNASGQYVCPLHGAVGLPNFDASGMPHCPICGQLMQFRCTNNYLPQVQISPHQNTVQVAAWGGGGAGGGGG